MKTSEERIRLLFCQLECDSRATAFAAEEELKKIVLEEGHIDKELCQCPQFAEWDEDYASGCSICGDIVYA